MITDLNLHPQARYQADLCVIGSGAAGLALASVLLQSGLRVVILESGAVDLEPHVQDLNRAEIDLVAFDGALLGRKRIFGGSTTCWGGQLLPLDENDFVARPWVEHSGWPFGRAELAAGYDAALRFTGARNDLFGEPLNHFLGAKSPFDPASLSYYFSKWSPHPRLRELYLQKIRDSSNVHLLFHANLTHLEMSADRTGIVFATTRNERLEESRIEATRFVLCAGGIETARILLSNDRQSPGGIGNARGLVGRFFQDHPSMAIGRVEGGDSDRLRHLFAGRDAQGHHYTPRFSPTPEVQQRSGLLNVSALMWFEYPPMLLRKAMLRNLLRRSLQRRDGARALISASSTLLASTLALRVRGRVAGPHNQFVINLISEQEPSPESRVTLSARRDRFGVRRARLAWRPTAKTWHTMMVYSRQLQRQFDSAKLGRLTLFPHVRESCTHWEVYPHDIYHHMGTTRMADTPEDGVVDRNCKVFGLDNLYIVSGGVFPTGGHSNCTLTILALAFRLLDHLGIARQPASLEQQTGS